MMKNLLLLLALVGLLAGCRKSSNYFIYDEVISLEEVGDIDIFYENVIKVPEVYSINPAVDDTIFTERATMIIIPANSFISSESGVLATEELDLQFLEGSTKSDHLMLNKSTRHNDFILEHHATIYIELTEAYKTFQLAEGAKIQIRFTNLSGDVIPSNGILYQSEDNSDQWIPYMTGNVSLSPEHLGMELDKMGWFAYANYIYNEPGYNFPATLSINLVENYSPENTVVYIVFNEFKTILKLDYDESEKEFHSGFIQNIPTFSPLTVIAISNRTPTTYFFGSVTKEIVETESAFNFDLRETSFATIKATITNL